MKTDKIFYVVSVFWERIEISGPGALARGKYLGRYDMQNRTFNINGVCRPDRHYMAGLRTRLAAIRKMVDAGAYFTMNRPRQYGKTTILRALADDLKDDYTVISLDFQRMSHADFNNEISFVHGLAREIVRRSRLPGLVPEKIREDLTKLANPSDVNVRMAQMFDCFSTWCERSDKPVVLVIDEVDTASNNQVFLDFLAQLRAAYLEQDLIPAFWSVILAGVHDVRSMRRKIRKEQDHRENSPWNIAADFRIDMEFSTEEIARMLKDYENDHHTGMDIGRMASLLYNYTSGYPYLVSWLCKCMDEHIGSSGAYPDQHAAWTEDGFLSAVKILLEDNNPLFDSLINKLEQFPELNTVISRLLFQGQSIPYNADDTAVRNAIMFGFVKIQDSSVQIANRLFEIYLHKSESF